MKKSRGAWALLLVLALAASMAMLSACGGSSTSEQKSEPKEELSVTKEATTEVEASTELRTDPFYVLVVGDDSREGTPNKKGQYADGKGRSDTLMLVRVDPANYKLSLVTISRDTQATYEGETCKINETYHKGGIEALKTAVNELTGVTPDYYLITTFVGFENLIETLGGLSIYVPMYQQMPDIVTNDPIEYAAGDHTLNGAEALVFARDRHSYDAYGSGEAFRQTNDRRILQRIIEQVVENPDTAKTLAASMLENITTDWDQEELLAFVEDFAANADKISFIRATGPYDGGLDEATQLWLAYRDEDTWKRIIEVVNEGGDPGDIVAEPISPEQDFMN